MAETAHCVHCGKLLVSAYRLCWSLIPKCACPGRKNSDGKGALTLKPVTLGFDMTCWPRGGHDDSCVNKPILRESGKLERDEYPRCPVCGGPVVAAMMTSGAILADGSKPDSESWLTGVAHYYEPSALSVYCESSSCNWDQPLGNLTSPAPDATNGERG